MPLVLLVLVFLMAAPAGAQQFATDDAGVVEAWACQVEAWVGEVESWILPACQLVPGVETTLGAVFQDSGTGSRAAHVVIEAKTLFRDADAEPWGLGLVAGGAVRAEGETGVSDAWLFVPVTVNVARAPLVLHGNLGWGFEREAHDDHIHDHHGLMWGVRADLAAHPRAELLAELFGLTGDGPQLQVGVRFHLAPDRLLVDASRGFHLDDSDEALGFQLGVAWIPPPLR